MKKFILTLVLAIIAGAFATTTPAWGATDTKISAENSEVEVISDLDSPQAVVTIILRDENGNPIAGETVNITTSRNAMSTREGAWEGEEMGKDVDNVYALYNSSSEEGTLIFLLDTEVPSGTTVLITLEDGTRLGPEEGIPLTYSAEAIASAN